MNRRTVVVIACLLLGVLPTSALAARHKTGARTLRGIVSGQTVRGFTLTTTTRGRYTVSVAAATTIVEKGVRGRIALHSGDHVGVTGFVHGRTIRAMRVRVYPVKPKPYSLRGTVTGTSNGRFVLTTSTGSVMLQLTSSTAMTGGRLSKGSRVEVRAESTWRGTVALRVHVYARHVAGVKVQVRGRIVSVGNTAVNVNTGTQRVDVKLTSTTVVHRGTEILSVHALARGQQVLIYACCAGASLQATSIHVRKGRSVVSRSVLRGRIVVVTQSLLRIDTGHGVFSFELVATTQYDVGSGVVRRTDLRLGDSVSVHARRLSSGWRADRVHVEAASRRARTLRGVVVSRNTTQIIVRGSKGTTYRIAAAHGIRVTVNGHATGWGSLQPGDRVRVHGLPGTNSGTYQPDSIEALRAVPRARTLAGVLISVGGGLTIEDRNGKRYRVQLAPHVLPHVGSESISVAALFSGVHVLVHGIVTAGRVLAVSMVVRLRRRTMEGRVLSVHGAVLMLRNRGANVRVDMPRNLMVADGRRALPVSSLRVGAIIQVDGWELDTAHLRAVHLAVKHPLVTATARVVEAGSTLVVQTARGDRYELVVPASLTIETSRGNLPLTATDIPMGARVHVEGRIGRRGKLRVLALSVRLTASTLRGAVNPTSLTSWTVQTATGVTSVRLGAQTIVEQGRHILTPSDVVHGDDATVYGYSLRTGIIARKIDVHRRLTGLDGTVTAVTPSGFTVSAVDGSHHVLTGSSTVYTGSLTAVSVGMDVHVTGYLRGDGSVLATRVRLLKGGRGE